jgi:hypothetical protein
MSQGKQSKFLPIYFSILGVGALGLGYMAWSASSSSDEAEEKYKQASTELSRLENAPLSRTDENAALKKSKVDDFVKQVRELNTTLISYQPPIAAESNDGFQKKLNEATKAVKDNAAAKGVTLSPKFDLGMGNYLSQFPVSGAAGKLSAQLDSIVYLSNAAMNAGVSSIDNLTRDPLDVEKEKKDEKATDKPKAPLTPAQRAKEDQKKKEEAAKAKAAPQAIDDSKVMERQPVTIDVTGKNRSVLNFLEALANTDGKDSPYFFIIRTLRIENELKDGPPKSVTVTEKEVTPNPEDKTSVYTQDAEFLLGNEKVKMHLDLDIVRFSDLPAEAAKTPGKPAPKPAVKPASGTGTPAPAPAPAPADK